MTAFDAVATGWPGDRVSIPLPFDPDAEWGAKPTHRVTGTVNGSRVRGPLARDGDGRSVLLVGAGWRRECGIAPGDGVHVELVPEGPQRGALAPDVDAALAASPEAAAFWDGLATFYKKGYLRWVDATTRKPDLRAARIAEMVGLLAEGKKERPK